MIIVNTQRDQQNLSNSIAKGFAKNLHDLNRSIETKNKEKDFNINLVKKFFISIENGFKVVFQKFGGVLDKLNDKFSESFRNLTSSLKGYFNSIFSEQLEIIKLIKDTIFSIFGFITRVFSKFRDWRQNRAEGKAIPKLQAGGMVIKEGAAHLHAGEVVSPARHVAFAEKLDIRRNILLWEIRREIINQGKVTVGLWNNHIVRGIRRTLLIISTPIRLLFGLIKGLASWFVKRANEKREKEQHQAIVTDTKYTKATYDYLVSGEKRKFTEDLRTKPKGFFETIIFSLAALGGIVSKYLSIVSKFSGLKYLASYIKSFKIVQVVFKFFEDIGSGLKFLTKWNLASLKTILGNTKFFSIIFEFFSKISSSFSIFNKFLPLLRSGFDFGKKLFWPIQIIFSIIDFTRGFISSEGDLLTKIKDGLKNVIVKFIELPAKILGAGVDYILEKFGISVEGGSASKIISFIDETVDMVFDSLFEPFRWFDRTLTKIGNIFKNSEMSWGEKFLKFFTELPSILWDWIKSLPPIKFAIKLGRKAADLLGFDLPPELKEDTETVVPKTEIKKTPESSLISAFKFTKETGKEIYEKTKNFTKKIGEGLMNFKGKTIDPLVMSGIEKASEISGVPIGYLGAMANVESGFNPLAKAKTSSASGLYQFTKGTWKEMVEKYGKEFNITESDIFDPEKNAIMGSLFAKENASFLQKQLNRSVKESELYLAHFLGKGGALNLLKAEDTQKAIDIVGEKAAKANETIFFNKDGSPKTVAQIKEWAKNKIEPVSEAFESSYNSSLDKINDLSQQKMSIEQQNQVSQYKKQEEILKQQEKSLGKLGEVAKNQEQTNVVLSNSNSGDKVPEPPDSIDSLGILAMNRLWS